MLAVAVAACGALAWASPAAFGAYAARVSPVFAFVFGISVVINAAQSVGALTRAVTRLAGSGVLSPARAWAPILGASLASTVFFSLDTTAILLTPIAVTLARRAGISTLGATFAVIWLANLGSLLLPISNLTNLLAAQSSLIDHAEFLRLSWAPSIWLAVVAAGAALLVSRGRSATRGGVQVREERWTLIDVLFLALIAALLLALVVARVPVWLSAMVAAAGATLLLARGNSAALRGDLVPWTSLLLAWALTACAAVLHHAHLVPTVPGGRLGVGVGRRRGVECDEQPPGVPGAGARRAHRG